MKKILIIEDDKNIKEALLEIFREMNYEPVAFTSAEEGVKYIDKNIPDLIICDIQLPGIDGFKFLEKIKKDDRLKLMPFIFLTARAEKEDWRKGMNIGADDYIIKPFKLAELLYVVDSKIGKYDELKSLIKSKKKDAEIEIFSMDNKLQKLDKNSFKQFQIKEIILIEAADQYTNLFLTNSRKLLIRKPIKDWEKILPGNIFLKAHRAYLVNKNFIENAGEVEPRNLTLQLKEIKKTINVSKRNISKIKKALQI
ncbi:MAG: response regulator [Melioribacteraceae bacterium]|nr:MAG: response regulator [Melioribacteraceae bacterium]